MGEMTGEKWLLLAFGVAGSIWILSYDWVLVFPLWFMWGMYYRRVEGLKEQIYQMNKKYEITKEKSGD